MTESIELEWCGHAYFLVKTGGLLIAIDPHDGGSLNIPTCRVQADHILVTHEHFDHNAVEVAGAPRAKEHRARSGVFEIDGVKVESIRVYHDKSQGRLRGPVTAYKLDIQGLTLAHLGDIGHIPTGEQLDRLKGVDVLLIPVGGTYTINAEEAWETINLVKPKIAIPMHYWIPGLTLPIDPVDRFLNIIKTPRMRLESNKLTISKETLPEKTTIIIPQPPRKT
ncbi:MAG: MBL fold metallo-hydrolase [Desulfurococcales archaeon]|nr:MBL fold metallo-hydrolase [Desulfurococcales archaeon]